MLNFIFHPHFEKEAASLKRRFPFLMTDWNRLSESVKFTLTR